MRLRESKKIGLFDFVPEHQVKATNIAINLKPDARRIVESIREETGIPNTEAMSRILTWFAEMPPAFRSALLTQEGQRRDELLLQWVKETLSATKLPIEIEENTVEARIKAVRKLLNDIELINRGQEDALRQLAKKSKGK